MKLHNRFSLLIIFAVLALTLTTTPTNSQVCGNVNSSGSISIVDGIRILDYLHASGYPIANPVKADIDTYQRVTTYDAVHIFDKIFISPPPYLFTCPGFNPPLHPDTYPELRITYTDTITSGASQAVISIALVNPFEVDWLTLPLRFRVDGAIPTIDSVVLDTSFTNPYNNTNEAFDIRHDSGVINSLLFSIFEPIKPSGVHHLMDVHISVPPASGLRTVDVSLVGLKPINHPTADTGVIPMAVKFVPYWIPGSPPHTPYTPLLKPEYICGDVNHDFALDSLDAQYLLEYYFNCGPEPYPLEAGDVNCDGQIDLNDLLLVNSVANGGNPALCCAHDLFPSTGDLPTIPPLTPRQDSLLIEFQQALTDLGW